MSRRPALPLEQFLTYRLHLVNKLTDQRSATAYAREFGLPIGEARCLAAIGNAQRLAAAGKAVRFVPVSVNALATQANLTKGQASRAAQGLVNRQLVSKTPSPVDGRGVALCLTPAGRALWGRVMLLITRRNEEIFSCLTGAEQQSLGSMLDRLIQSAKAPGELPS